MSQNAPVRRHARQSREERAQERPTDVTISDFIRLVRTAKAPVWIFLLGLLGSLITTGISLVIPLIVREAVDGITLDLLTWQNIVLVIGSIFLQLLVAAFSSYLLTKFGQYVVAKIREQLWAKMIKLPIPYFDQNRSGELASRVVGDTGVIRETVSRVLSQLINGALTIVGVLILLFTLDWKMTSVSLISLPVIFVVIIPLSKFVRRNSRELRNETAEFTGNVQETLAEMRLLKASTAEETEQERGFESIDKIYRLSLREAKLFAIVHPLMSLVLLVALIGILGYGVIRVVNGLMSVGDVVAFVIYLFQLIGPLMTFANFYTQIQSTIGATSRIIEIMDIEDEQGHETGAEVIVDHKTISFENVDFSYIEEKAVLRDVSFSAKSGEKIAFVGSSGAGKTTIFSLIERFYKPSSGSIKIGGQDIDTLNLRSWRSQLGYVSQDNALLYGSVRDNLLYGHGDTKQIEDADLWNALEMSFAKAFVEDMPDGLDTIIGERGVKLSGGQRQRLSIARAFLRDPEILLLDEATASLDSQSEKIVQEALDGLMENRTTLVIAHRLSTITDADLILLLEEGRIAASGTHEELLETSSIYRNYSRQQQLLDVE